MSSLFARQSEPNLRRNRGVLLKRATQRFKPTDLAVRMIDNWLLPSFPTQNQNNPSYRLPDSTIHTGNPAILDNVLSVDP